MDHLPVIQDAIFEPVKVPLLCTDCPYDGGGMLDFPSRQGWELRIRESDIGDVGSLTSLWDRGLLLEEAKTAFLQSWLFFGLLSDVLKVIGIGFDLENFAVLQDNTPLISTEKLPRYIEQWRDRESAIDEYTQRSHQHDVCCILERAGDITTSLLSFPFFKFNGADTDENDSTRRAKVGLSIFILGDTLANAARNIWRAIPNLELAVMRNVRFSESAPFTLKRLKDHNWCISERMMLRRFADNIGLYLASLLQRDPLSSSLDHRKCSTFECKAMTVSEELYTMRHVSRECKCSLVCVDSHRAADIIMIGDIPCVEVTEKAEGGPKFDVVPGSGREYVAFSHVWAHGFGNPKLNGMFLCQLRRLCEFGQALRSSESSQNDSSSATVCIWIDTLCIPVTKQLDYARKRAIVKLTDTFRHASQVVVLDADLLSRSSRMSPQELDLRLHMCAWMRRVWTLQEALESKQDHLYWQFKDQAVSEQHLRTRQLPHVYDSDYTDALKRRLRDDLRYQQGDSTDPASRILGVIGALLYRTTSKSEDETLCLAPMLHLDRAPLLQTNDTAERMKIFLSMWPSIPSYFLFFEGPRIEQEGCRWMPQSFIGGNPKSGKQHDGYILTKYDHNGLYVKYLGFTFVDPSPMLHHYLEVGFELPFEGRWYTVSDTGLIMESLLPETQRWAYWREQLHTVRQLGFLIEGPRMSSIKDRLAVFIDITETRNGIIFGKFLCRVFFLSRAEQNTKSIENDLKSEFDGRIRDMQLVSPYGNKIDYPLPPAHFSATSSEQMWCVG